MIITTTPTVEGYHITNYLGTVTGASTYLLGGIIGEGLSSKRQSSLFSSSWQEAVDFMARAAGNADAIVGAQHTLCGVANGYMVVTVTGTAVKLTEDIMYEEEMQKAKQRELERKQEAQQRELERKQEIAEEREQLLKAHQDNVGINPKGEEAYYPIPTEEPSAVQCPKCKSIQPKGRHVCWKCGCPFMYEE